MNISASDIILFAHAGFGVAGTLAALWVFVEALHARPESAPTVPRASWIRGAALVSALCIAAAWICGGYWYVVFYPADKALILAGPWPFAHNLFMETKEHLFFAVAMLAFLLPVAAREAPWENAAARRLILAVSGLVVITAMAVEGAGAVIEHGVRLALIHSTGGGAHQ